MDTETAQTVEHMTLDMLEVGSEARIVNVGGDGALRRHFLDMGVIPGARIEFVKRAPLGDPIEFRIHDYALTLRSEDASKIEIEFADADELGSLTSAADLTEEDAEHPGLGEGGRFHSRADENPLPEGTTLTFALAGNQNCGKTTLFNQLTGSNQRVGNFPGVTVDRKEGPIRGRKNTNVVDLPGIYSMSPYSAEEIVSRQYILDEKPTGIINIVDATNIERNLYLTMQLMELDVPMVLALNMMDEVQNSGGSIRVNEMEGMLGIPVVPISAVHKEGVNELVDHALHVAHYQERPGRQDFCDASDNGGAVHRCLHAVMHLIEDHAERASIPLRFAATKLVEGDALVQNALDLTPAELEMVESVVAQMEEERGLDRAAAIAEMRYSFISKVVSRSVVKPAESLEQGRSRAIDKVLTGRWTAIPMFILVMAVIFLLTFNVIGPFFQDIIQMGLDAATIATVEALDEMGAGPIVESFIVGGVFAGVGTVLLFFPIIVVMFFFLSMLEDSGYIARVAFFMDKLLRKIGLSGRSIVPMLIGFGCTVPAVMSTRTLPSERDRRMTILLTPFMSCTAKLPIYGFFVAAFFPKRGWLVMVALYALGILTGIAAAALYKSTLFKGEAVPLVLELPNYRLPSPRSVMQLLWEKSKDFLQRAFSVILVATIVVWFLSHFDTQFNLTEDMRTSILALLSGWLAPILKPLGLGDWRVATSLITGFMAKESVVTVMQMLYRGETGVAAAMSTLSAASMLAFSLLYTPCVAAVAAIRRELGRRWAVGVVLWQCGIAWFVALCVRVIGLALGLG